jgi:hypothetical protein
MATHCGADSGSCNPSTRNRINLAIFVTGAAGFIGSNFVDRLLSQDEDVVGYDNLSTGLPEFIALARRHKNFTFVEGDLLDPLALTEAMRGATRVVHLGAQTSHGIPRPLSSLARSAKDDDRSAMPPKRYAACQSSNAYTRELRDDHCPQSIAHHIGRWWD